MNGFWGLLRESVLVQATMALACLAAIIYLAVTGQPIPEVLTNVMLTIIGFYFGSKVTQAQFDITRKK